MTERKRGRPPGPRIRTIKPEMPQDDGVAKLSVTAELLFVRLISMADDEGRFEAPVNKIIGFAFPHREAITPAKVRKMLHEIETQKMILRYEVDGLPYGVVRHFRRHQAIQKPTPSRLPEPPDREIVDANAPVSSSNYSRTNTGEIQEPVQDHSGLPHAGAGAGASAPLPLPSSSSSTSTTEDNQQRGARENGKTDPLLVPTDMPVALASMVDPVLAILRQVQAERGGKVPTPRAVALKIIAFPDRDHVKVAHELRYWATEGRGTRRNPQDWARQYGAFLDEAAPASPSRPGGSQSTQATKPVANSGDLSRFNREPLRVAQ